MRFCFVLISLLLVLPQVSYGQETVPTPEEVTIERKKRDFTNIEVELLQELEKRRVELDRREKAIELRERLVDLAEKRLSERAGKMNELKSDLGMLLNNLSEKEEEELQALAKIYESMKPAAAANVMDRMDNKIVFDVFKRMKQKSTAKIMEKMSTVKARIVSEMLAEKSELPVFK
jgi:flagellar motility protein MotE (MotC chaperone)